MNPLETLIIQFLDIFGTFVFAISGAFKAIKHELDLLGVLVLAIATGIGGGILRDLLIGYTPPSALRDETFFVVCCLGGLAVFFAAPKIAKRWDMVLIADAIGLGVFTAIGAATGLEKGVGITGVLLLGVLTATGGGVLRDVLVREIPMIIRKDFYATASLLGGLVLVVLARFHIDKTVTVFACMFSTILIRLLAMRLKFELPRARSLPESPSQIAKEYKRKPDRNKGL
jgi:uncharacterized membrane protein YeiH